MHGVPSVSDEFRLSTIPIHFYMFCLLKIRKSDFNLKNLFYDF